MMRYEVKLVGGEADYSRLIAELRMLPSLLRCLHPTRVVQSVYLDSDDGLAVRDNLAGISSRQKLRLPPKRGHRRGLLLVLLRRVVLPRCALATVAPDRHGAAARLESPSSSYRSIKS